MKPGYNASHEIDKAGQHATTEDFLRRYSNDFRIGRTYT
jgi:hypothetical protein